MLSSSSKIAPLRVAVENTQRLSRALERCVNYTYASKFILGIDDLRTCTGAEKDAVVLILFQLMRVLDLRMCSALPSDLLYCSPARRSDGPLCKSVC